jgi:hypothetical protein
MTPQQRAEICQESGGGLVAKVTLDRVRLADSELHQRHSLGAANFSCRMGIVQKVTGFRRAMEKVALHPT